MKKNYLTPIIEVMELGTCDVILASYADGSDNIVTRPGDWDTDLSGGNTL